MTPEEMVIEAVLVAVAKGIGVVCIVAMFAIVGRSCYRAWQAALNGAADDIGM